LLCLPRAKNGSQHAIASQLSLRSLALLRKRLEGPFPASVAFSKINWMMFGFAK